ncbi:hypothetical protein B0H65DRAFT_466583 [Neurospora tetraspora]|uniref:Uncharacterized protein n=1 Tax=Neurospora tetraspora TaxID=94610 RepID=A0AAE0JFL5_9PEZI|nr:hypothetical protein B0H65DRAFT_466583 [Neurospora tetraspora]
MYGSCALSVLSCSLLLTDITSLGARVIIPKTYRRWFPPFGDFVCITYLRLCNMTYLSCCDYIVAEREGKREEE